MASMLKLPPGLWITSRRPYFNVGMKNLNKNLPYCCQKVIRDTDKNHSVFEELGFELGPQLGEGSFSTVVMGFWKQYKLNVAVKIYSKENERANPALMKLPTEIEMLRLLKHPNIVSFFGAWESKYHIYIVLELVGNSNLLEYILENGPVNEDKAKLWFAQLVSAVKFAHDMEVAHRDIKCENILLDMSLNIRLSDFGFATPEIPWFDDIPNSSWAKDTIFCGSLAYMAPEILMKKPFSPLLADVWAVGIVLYCMLFGKFPVASFTENSLLEMIYQFKLPHNHLLSLSPKCVDVFRKIFVLENSRIRSNELLEVDWIKKRTREIDLGRNAKLTVYEVGVEKARAARILLRDGVGTITDEDDDTQAQEEEEFQTESKGDIDKVKGIGNLGDGDTGTQDLDGEVEITEAAVPIP